MSNREKIQQMATCMVKHNWEAAFPFFTKDVLYKVGTQQPVIGAKAVTDYLRSFYNVVTPALHELRGSWEMDDGTVILEMDASYVRVADGKLVTVPCCDVFRFEGELIKEWRVYPDMSAIYK